MSKGWIKVAKVSKAGYVTKKHKRRRIGEVIISREAREIYASLSTEERIKLALVRY